jgi:hypothetical protein
MQRDDACDIVRIGAKLELELTAGIERNGHSGIVHVIGAAELHQVVVVPHATWPLAQNQKDSCKSYHSTRIL